MCMCVSLQLLDCQSVSTDGFDCTLGECTLQEIQPGQFFCCCSGNLCNSNISLTAMISTEGTDPPTQAAPVSTVGTLTVQPTFAVSNTSTTTIITSSDAMINVGVAAGVGGGIGGFVIMVILILLTMILPVAVWIYRNKYQVSVSKYINFIVQSCKQCVLQC